MTGILERHRDAIADLCTRFRVLRLEAFGSALRDDFDPKDSDLDFLVEFKAMEPYERVDAYFGMREQLARLLQQKVDLVMAGAVKNPYIAREIERTKQSLYAA